MKNESLKKLSAYLAVTAASLMMLVAVVSYFLTPGNRPLLLAELVVSALVGALLFWILIKVFDRWLGEQIKPIYGTLKSIVPEDKALNSDLMSADDNLADVVSKINEDVAMWAKDKTNEITMLKNNEKYRKEFLGNVSHELKTPLFNIQGYIETLIDGGMEDPEINMKYLQRTANNIERLIGIVTDLESISKMESGRQDFNIEPFNITALAEEVIEFYDMTAKQKGIKLGFKDGIKPAPMMVMADKDRIYEVLSNLISNSIRYGNKDGYSEVRIFDIETKVLIEVADNGIGIADENLSRVFERFFREDKARSRQVGGTGLGLSIVRHIVEAHGERITVNSKKGEGSTFSFTLKKAEK
ncbi:MAG: cell wall metabolism sensor histidine kinase WalK [Bacteroidales bacterium]|nr:cell wall metabolism sensor histidine kinase WalK [Bacteroidales bacterium]